MLTCSTQSVRPQVAGVLVNAGHTSLPNLGFILENVLHVYLMEEFRHPVLTSSGYLSALLKRPRGPELVMTHKKTKRRNQRECKKSTVLQSNSFVMLKSNITSLSLLVLFFHFFKNGTQHRAAIVLPNKFTQPFFISTKGMSLALGFWHAKNLMHDT